MTHLNELVNDFIRDHTDLFSYIWKRDDNPTDQELGAIADTWYDEHEENPPWDEVEELVPTLAEKFDWSLQQFDWEQSYPYELSDILFDSERENRIFGRK